MYVIDIDIGYITRVHQQNSGDIFIDTRIHCMPGWPDGCMGISTQKTHHSRGSFFAGNWAAQATLCPPHYVF
jgi:hypothetical protein